jgi:dihydrofolate synthase/folylpolyglutamate synthase
VVGVSIDKKGDEIVGALAPSFDMIICAAAHHKGMDAENIAAAVRKANPEAKIHVAATIEDAVEISGALAASQNRKIYVAGGLFVAIEYATVVRGGHAQDLNFF